MPPKKTRKNLHHWHKTRIRPLKPALSPIEEFAQENNSNYENENSIGGSNNNIGHNPVTLAAAMAAPAAGPVRLAPTPAPMSAFVAPQAIRPVAIGAAAPGGGSGLGSGAFSAFKKPNPKGGRRRRVTKKRNSLSKKLKKRSRH